MSYTFDWKGFAIFGVILFFVSLPLIGNYTPAPNNLGTSQTQNFQEDLNKAGSYWVHIDRAWDLKKNGQYQEAVDEYQLAIEIIQKMPGDKWPNLKKEDVDRINQQARIDAQIFPRYGLIEALEGAGQYREALESVDWLVQNQHIKGKEELLEQKLGRMKQSLLQKIEAQSTQNQPTQS